MSQNTFMQELLKRQEQQRIDLMAGAYKAWQLVKENEGALLKPFGGAYEDAFEEVQGKVNEGRQAYFEEWGADGKLSALMTERHVKERELCAKQMSFINNIHSSQEQNKYRGRER